MMSYLRKESDTSSSASNISQSFINSISTDIPSTSRSIGAERKTQLPDILNDSRDIALNNHFGTPTFENRRPLTFLGSEDSDEKLLAYFFLKNMYPTDDDLQFLCRLTDMDREYVEDWFDEQRSMYLPQCSLRRNQYPLALVYFKSKL